MPVLTRLTRRAEAVARLAVELEPMPQPPLRPTRHPVVFMHGLGALANLMQGGVLHAEAMHLRGRGVLAYAPHVNPYDSVTVRAATWAERFRLVLEETRAEKLNLVGFSSGGLDARLLAREPEWAARIASLVTVSTPHRGSDLASYVLDKPERLRSWAMGIMEFVGRAAYEGAVPHPDDALEELTPAAVTARFPPDELIDGAWCASYDSAAGKDTDVPIYAPLIVPNRILHGLAGVNDGIVPTSSMVWGEHLDTLEADHAKQIGLRLAPTTAYDSFAFFEAHAEQLRARDL